eukprot:2758278-Prymnesium_polylepis.1
MAEDISSALFPFSRVGPRYILRFRSRENPQTNRKHAAVRRRSRVPVRRADRLHVRKTRIFYVPELAHPVEPPCNPAQHPPLATLWDPTL